MTGIADELHERTVNTALGTVRLQVAGSDAPIIFWPSLLMTGDMWHKVADKLVARSQVILVDPPGHGGSQPLTGMFTLSDCGRCVVDILDGLGLDWAHFVGNSWGGMTGATFAARHPERIGRAVLMNCTAGRASLRQKLQFAVLLRLAQWQGEIGAALTRPVLKAFLGPTTLRERPEVVAQVRSAIKSVNIASASWAVRSVVPARPDQRALCAGIRTPVLVVGGAEDATFPPREAIAMADAIPGSSVRVLDKVAHLAGLEDPASVSALIEDFLFADEHDCAAP